jgi:multidrug resistance efflux pump
MTRSLKRTLARALFAAAACLASVPCLAAQVSIPCKAVASDKYYVLSPLAFDSEDRIPMRSIKLMVDIGTKVDEGTRLLSYTIDKDILLQSVQGINEKLSELATFYDILRAAISKNIVTANDYAMIRHPQADLFYSKNTASDIAFYKSSADQKYSMNISELKSLYDDLHVANSTVKEYFRITSLDYGKLPREAYLTAPYSCYVLSIDSRVRNGANVFTNKDPVMVLGNLDPIKVVGFADQSIANKFAIGKTVNVVFDSTPEVTYQATVLSLQAQDIGTSIELPSTFEVFFEIKNPEFKIKDGMRGRVLAD